MLAADKLLLQSNVKQRSIALREKELKLFNTNFSAVGTLLVFWTEFGCGPHAPMLLKQGYLVVTSALLAWSTTQMPEWSTWAILAGVSLWDILAVSAGAAAAPPCAPTPRPCLRRCAFGTARSV